MIMIKMKKSTEIAEGELVALPFAIRRDKLQK